MFCVVYKGAGESLVNFTRHGTDEEENAIYVARLTKGKPITEKSTLDHAWCGSCGANLPPFLVGTNRYVRLACSATDT